MNKGLVRKLLPHFIAVVIFLIIALIYCKPALQGMVLQQSDIVQWKAMAQNSFEFKEKHGHFPLWTNGMFSGMPAYQIAMEPDIPVTPMWFHGLATLYLPKPISFFFLACICFYFLSQVLRVNPYIGILGALAYAYATYNPIIVAVGHDTKMLTIGYLPAFLGALILLYEKKYIWGAALTAVFTALLVTFNHMQIVYYGLIITAFMVVGYAVYWFKRQELKHFFIASAIALGAGLIGVLSNAVQIMTTLESSKTTIRGGTELPDANATKTGLSKDYAFSYSMYKTEPFVMMVPKMYGGSDGLEIDQEDSKAVEQLQQMPQELAQQLQYNLRFYWGGIGGTSGPPYVGAIICFLTLIGFFILDSKHKWWILACSVLAIVMSWGSYFDGFNGFLLKYLPMYNKFRAPSMILVIPTFLFCIMAVLTMQRIVEAQDRDALWERYKKGLMLAGGALLAVVLIYFSADFSGESDKRLTQFVNSLDQQIRQQVNEYARNFLNALKEDRKTLFFGSLVRTFLFMAAAAAVLWMAIRKKFSAMAAVIILGVLSFIDVMSINTRYLNADNYQEQEAYDNNFVPSATDQKILQDKSFYRVFDLRQGVGNAFNGGQLTMYHHKSIGGYHPAKLSIYQDLIEHQLYKVDLQQLFFNPGYSPVINMLNTKYFLFPTQGGDSVIANTGNLGAAWFVKAGRYENGAPAVMQALTSFNPKDTAVFFAADKSKTGQFNTDSAATIQLVSNDNDEVTYVSNSASGGFAVFSEIYYDKGWKAYVDEKETPIVRTNYVLRGIQVPAGKHNIKFVFHPASYYSGESIALIAGILVMLLVLAAIFQSYRRSRTVKA